MLLLSGLSLIFNPLIQCIESAIANLARVTDVLCEAAAQFERVFRVTHNVEEEKSDLVWEVIEAEAKVQDLIRSEVAAVSGAEVAKAEVALLRAEVDAARRHEAEGRPSRARSYVP